MAELTLAEVALLVRADTKRVRPDVEQASVGAGRAGGEKLGEGITRGINRELAGNKGKFVAAGKAMGADLGKGFQAEFSGSGTFAKTLAVMASRLAIMGAAAGAAAPGVAHLAAALAPAAGAAVVLPAALLAIKAATATVKIAVMGVGDAISAGFGDNSEKAAEALGKLSGSARVFAKEVIALRPQVSSLQKSVASGFFRPLVGEIQPLANAYLPMLRERMTGLAGVIGGLGEELLRSAGKAKVMAAVSSLFDNTSIAGVRLRAAIEPVVDAFAALIRATAPQLPGMATGFANMATSVARFIESAADSGRVVEVFENAKRTLRDLGGILSNVGSIFGSVMSAASLGSESLLSNLRDVTGQVAAFFKSAQGSAALTSVFTTLGALGDALKTGLAAVLPAIGRSVQLLGPALAGLAGPASQIVVAIAPLLPFVAGLAAAVARALTPALSVLAGWMVRNEQAIKVAVVAIGAFIVAAKLSAVAAGVQAAGGIAAWAKATVSASAIGRAFTAVQYGIGVAMRFALGPIGLVIAAIGALVAAVVWAYKNNETFRVGVQKVWAVVRDFIRSAITTIGTVIRNTWNNIIAPALRALNTFIRTVVMPTINWLWHNVVQPAFAGIGRIIQAAWAVIRLVLAAMVAYYRNVVFPVIRFLWENLVRPVFNSVRDHIADTWNNRIKPVLTLLGNFIRDKVAPAFRTGVDAIAKAWDGLKAAARKPIEFVVNSVINPLINGFNKVAGIFGTPKIDPIGGFADGGQIPGAPSTKDNTLARGPGGLLKVATGEFITNTKSTLANLPLIKAINAKRGKVTRKDLDPYLDGREDGGMIGDGIGDLFGKIKAGISGAADFISDPKAAIAKIANAALARIPGGGAIKDFVVRMGRRLIEKMGDWFSGQGAGGALGSAGGAESWQAKRAIIKRWFPNLNMISGFRPGARTLSGNQSLHARGLAVDYPPSRPLAARIKAVYGKQTQELITPFQELNLLHGRPHRFTGAVWNQHNFAGGNAHVHWGAKHGGLIDPKSGGLSQVTSADFGSVTLQRGWNMVHNGLGRPEPLADPLSGSDVADLLRELIAVTAANPAGFARAMGGTSTGLMREARRR